MERETQWANFRDIMIKIDESMTKTDTKKSFVKGNTQRELFSSKQRVYISTDVREKNSSGYGKGNSEQD